jgi:DNA helicase-2/ATP-dependent DNA helicase PcrA
VDFDDLVVAPVRVLRRQKGVRDKWQARFEHLLVDEFQDTNHAQLELVRLLTNEQNNVCVVGDDDQSIYGWRGAEVGNILDFEHHFPGTKVVKLEDNYRSRSSILHVANSVIAQNQGKRHGKTLRAARGEGPNVRLCTVEDAAAEAKLVIKEMRQLAEQGRSWGDMAVLYRSNTQARLIEEELRVEGIPYRLQGGTQFFDRKEVKDAIAYLKVVVNPRDELSLRRIVNNPPRGIGETTLERLSGHARMHRMSLAKALSQIDHVEGVSESARRGAHALHSALERARRRFHAGDRLTTAARDLFSEVGLERELTAESEGQQGARRWENIEFLLRSIQRFEQSESKDKQSMAQFLARLTIRFDQESEETGDRVTLSTLHAAKGLEFGTVFLIGCVEGHLPHSRTTDPKVTEAAPTDVDEERRLFYVGITRACDQLYLFHPERKTMRGKTVKLTPSRFLDSLPTEGVHKERLEVQPAMDNSEMADMAAQLLQQLGGT